MSTIDDVLKALGDMERRLTSRIDGLEQKVDALQAKVDILGTSLLSPYEQAQHKFAALVARNDRR